MRKMSTQNCTPAQWKRPVLINHIFFYITWMARYMCRSFTLVRVATRMRYRKKQCNALGNFLLQNLGSCHSCGTYLDINHILYLNIVADHIHPIMEMVVANGSGLFQQNNEPCCTSKCSRIQHVGSIDLVSRLFRSQSH